MIIDRIENVRDYFFLDGLSPGLEELKKLGNDPKPKRYDFEGGYFFISEGKTMYMEEGGYEAHKKFVDVQYILKGCEEIAWANVDDLKLEAPYQEDRDIAMYLGDATQINIITEGMFWIALPQDAHKPARHRKTPHQFKKVVFKLPYREGK